jgi:hypothetical protein
MAGLSWRGHSLRRLMVHKNNKMEMAKGLPFPAEMTIRIQGKALLKRNDIIENCCKGFSEP